MLPALVAMLLFALTGVSSAQEPTGTLVFEHDIEGAPAFDVVVFLAAGGEVFLGTVEFGEVVEVDLPEGTHSLELFGPGLSFGRFEFEIIAGQRTSVSASEVVAAQGPSEIALEVYCYFAQGTVLLDASQAEAAEQCSQLGEFGRDWEQTLDVLDAESAIIATLLPQLVTDDNAVIYPPDGAWRAPEPILPEGWTVVECPFLDPESPLTNGVGQTVEAENLPYVDRVHVVCYWSQAPTPTPTPTPVRTPTRIDTGGGGTAGW